MTPAILALDPASAVGWAIRPSDPGCCIEYGTLVLGARKSRGERGLAFARWLAETIDGRDIGLIAFESPAMWGPNAQGKRIAGGLAMVIEMQAARHRVAILELQPSEWRHAIGLKGNATKDEVMAAVVGLGHKPGTQDEADAIAILLHAASRVGK